VDVGLKNMEQVILKMQSLPDQLHLLANHPPAQGRPPISDHIAEAYETDLLPGKILEAIKTNSGLQEITIAQCLDVDGRTRYQGNLYVPESDLLHLRIIQEYHDTGLAGHMRSAKTFDLFDQQ
jgi:hypothetical protein